jgi:hypothetical protein
LFTSRAFRSLTGLKKRQFRDGKMKTAPLMPPQDGGISAPLN